jgi:hypothetical protein
MHANTITMRQRNATNAFAFDFYRDYHHIGGFDFAMFSQAQNARLKFHEDGSTKGDVAVTLDSYAYRMTHTYTKRAFNNDVLYQLVIDATGEEVARIELTRVKGQRWPNLYFIPRGHERMYMDISGNFLRRKFFIRRESDQFEVARITDTSSIFSVRRKLTIETTNLTMPQQSLIGIFLSFFRP